MRYVWAIIAACMLTTSAYAQTVGVPVFQEPPKAGDLGYKQLVLIEATDAQSAACDVSYNKGPAPGRWYNALIGGNTKAGEPRLTAECVLVVANSVIPGRGQWKPISETPATVQPVARTYPAPARPRVLETEPGKGQLGAGEVVFVRTSPRISCPGQVVKIVGASSSEGRRTRSCVASP